MPSASTTKHWPGSGSPGLNPAIVSHRRDPPNLKNVGQLKGATEHRPGTYILQ